MPRVDLDEVVLHYQQTGRGPDLVMVHGLLSSLAFFYLYALPLLTSHFRITLFDLRGHGLSGMPARGYTTRDLAEDIDALLDHLALERVHLVGHSYGGAVCLHYAALHPDRVLSLVAADAQVPSLPPRPPVRGGPRWRATMRALRARGYDVPDEVPRVVFGFLEEIARHPDSQDATALATAALDSRSNAQLRWRTLMQTTTASRELGGTAGLTPRRMRSVKCPTLAVYGEHSYCLPTQRALARNIRDCRRSIVRGAGHMFPARKPEAFANAVRSFALERSR